MRILHRYILKEMLKALGLALVAVSGVVCFGIVLMALQSKGLGPVASLMYMGLSIPGAVYIALPLSAVLAATLVYGRLAADNEVTACRASGIAPATLFWPTILLAAIAAGITFLLASWPLPESGYAAKKLALADIEHLFFSQLSGGHINVKEANFEMSVDLVADNVLYGPTVVYRDAGGQTYCYAPSGRIEFDRARNQAKLILWNAYIVGESYSGPVKANHVVYVDLPTDVPRKEDDLPIWALLSVQAHPENSDTVRGLGPNTQPAAVEHAKESVRARSIAELHSRLVAGLGCFGLVLVGAGLGMYFHSGHLLTAFGVALAPWLGATVLTMASVKTVAQAHNPQGMVWLIWTPNFLVVLLGFAILAGLVWVWAHPVRLRHRLLGRRPAAGRGPARRPA